MLIIMPIPIYIYIVNVTRGGPNLQVLSRIFFDPYQFTANNIDYCQWLVIHIPIWPTQLGL